MSLNVRTVTANQFYDKETYPHVSLTSDTLTWDSTTTLYHEQEMAMTDLHSIVGKHATVRGHRPTLVINSICLVHTDLINVTDDDNFHHALSSHVVISGVEMVRS